MLSNIFNLENPIWVFMGKLVDLVVLTGLWFVCSLPVVTVGASTKALYTAAMRLSKNEEGYAVRDFFKAFRSDFKESTCMGLAAAALGVFLASDLYVYWKISGRAGIFLFTVFLILSAVYLMTLAYLYPLMASTEYHGLQLAVVSFVTACKNPGWSMLMVLVMGCVTAAGIFVCAPLLAAGVGLAAYIQCKITVFVTKYYHINLNLERRK